ncbi:hypothetical protein [Actinocatenispora sera]|uniref:Uncharacterized protein n=1 Tax=Actinocatenispora sera TaxID=390989 RepID=A0A810L558_9ACTN|nr:hypothetical protein [Actinocatenispora sera]BCJ29772.1 hypothetical protein Asera_38800 [Actinocatenispora sera]
MAMNGAPPPDGWSPHGRSGAPGYGQPPAGPGASPYGSGPFGAPPGPVGPNVPLIADQPGADYPPPVGPNVPLIADEPGAGYPPGPPVGHPGGPAGWPAPTPPRRAPRRSHKGLIIGLVGGFCVLVLIGCAIAGFNVWQHHQQEQATLAIYQRIGRPDGFDPQGEPQKPHHTALTATWTGRSEQGDDLVGAATDWLGKHSKNPPSQQDVQDAFAHGRTFYLDDQAPANVELKLSSASPDYRIDVSIIS